MSQVAGAMQALRRLAGPRRFLLVGDSKLLSYPNIAAMTAAAGVTFLAPASMAFVPAQTLAGCDYRAAAPVDFVAARDAHRPEDQRGRYRVVEDTMTITGPLKRDPTHHPAAGVSCTPRPAPRPPSTPAPRNSTAPATTCAGWSADWARSTTPHPTRSPSSICVSFNTSIAGKRHVTDYLRTTIGTDDRGKPTLDWSFDQAAIDAEAATDGWYTLLTKPARSSHRRRSSHPIQEPAHRLRASLPRPERTLAVAPMFLHTNRRITALIGLVCLALIFCLIEREARRNLAPATKLDGLYVGRPAVPTAALIFTTLATLRLRNTSDGTPEIPEPTQLQQRILDLLKIDPRTADDPPHPMCELRG